MKDELSQIARAPRPAPRAPLLAPRACFSGLRGDGAVAGLPIGDAVGGEDGRRGFAGRRVFVKDPVNPTGDHGIASRFNQDPGASITANITLLERTTRPGSKGDSGVQAMMDPAVAHPRRGAFADLDASPGVPAELAAVEVGPGAPCNLHPILRPIVEMAFAQRGITGAGDEGAGLDIPIDVALNNGSIGVRDKNSVLGAIMNSAANDFRSTVPQDSDARPPVAENFALFQDTAAVLGEVDALASAVVDLSAPDDWISALLNVDIGARVSKNFAFLDDAGAAAGDVDAARVAVIDLASSYERIRAPLHHHPCLRIPIDLAVFNNATGMFREYNSSLLTVMDIAAANGGISPISLGYDAGEPSAREIAIFQNHLALTDLDGEMFTGSHGETPDESVPRTRQDAGSVHALDNNFIGRPVTDNFNRSVKDNAFTIPTRPHQDSCTGDGVLNRIGNGFDGAGTGASDHDARRAAAHCLSGGRRY